MKLAKYETFQVIELKQYKSELERFLSKYEAKHTHRRYTFVLNALYDYIVSYNIQYLDQLDFDFFTNYKKHLLKTKSETTVSNAFSIIRKFFNFLVTRGKLVRNESLEVTTTRPSTQDAYIALTREEVFTLKETALGSTQYDLMNQIILILGFNLGMRREEIVNLKHSNIEKRNGGYSISITGKGRKKRTGALDTLTGDILITLIKDYENLTGVKFTRNDYVVQSSTDEKKNKKPMDASSLYRRFKRLVEKSGIEKEVSPHSMRATLATALYGNGYDISKIQRVLGHEDQKTTMNYIKEDVDYKNAIEMASGL